MKRILLTSIFALTAIATVIAKPVTTSKEQIDYDEDQGTADYGQPL